MAKIYKAVIIGTAHMHSLYMSMDCNDNPQIDLCGISDTLPLMDEHSGKAPFTRKWNLEYITKKIKVPFYSDYKKMLDEVKPEIAFLTMETPLHVEVFEECAKRGIITSMEKPMAVNLSEGLKMLRIAKATRTELLVNWPLAWMPFMTQYKQIVDEGHIGKLLKIRALAGHPGPLGRGVKHARVEGTMDAIKDEEKSGSWWHKSSVGGGALLDFCSNGVMASNWLTGKKANAVMGMRCNTNSQWGDAEDNAVLLVSYSDCIAVLEGSWTIPSDIAPIGPELYGSEGTVSCEVRQEGVIVKVNDFNGNVTYLPLLKPEPQMRNVTTAIVHHLETGEPLPSFLDIDVNTDVMAVLDAGIRSSTSGKLEVVRNITWEIG